MKIRRRDQQLVEMQMGPMIDMVFLLLVFFMVTAKPIKQESDISLGLPGTVAAEEAVDLPDEQRIRIEDDGTINPARSGQRIYKRLTAQQANFFQVE